MEEYEVFDEYIKKSRKIRGFCNERERMLFEAIRIDTDTKGKLTYLKAIGVEIDKVMNYIDELNHQRKCRSLGI
jgi:hypothetical protein